MKWIKKVEGAHLPIKSWCEPIEPGAFAQAENLSRHPALVHFVALMPDCHVGYGMPIGGVVASRDSILPSAVGVDIGCGMIAVETNLSADSLSDMKIRRRIQDKLKERIPVGEGVSHRTAQNWSGFEKYLDLNGQVADFVNALDRKNLGTLGGGNHFIELQKSDKNKIWLMIHSGSRNLGTRVEKFYQQKATNYVRKMKVSVPDPDLVFLSLQEKDGQDYFRDMHFALDYALENRRRMMQIFKETIKDFMSNCEFLREVNIHHNYAAMEEHFSEKLCIHRKGATSAKKDEIGIIPGSMGTASYIVRGLGNPESFMSCSHGAGRQMSRTAACQKLNVIDCNAAMDGIVFERWRPVRRFRKTQKILDLSEAPQAYKDIDEVIEAELDLIEPIVKLLPIAVLKG